MEAFDQTGYKGYLTFEYFHPVSALSRSADLSDGGFAGSDAWNQGINQQSLKRERREVFAHASGSVRLFRLRQIL